MVITDDTAVGTVAEPSSTMLSPLFTALMQPLILIPPLTQDQACLAQSPAPTLTAAAPVTVTAAPNPTREPASQVPPPPARMHTVTGTHSRSASGTQSGLRTPGYPPPQSICSVSVLEQYQQITKSINSTPYPGLWRLAFTSCPTHCSQAMLNSLHPLALHPLLPSHVEFTSPPSAPPTAPKPC